MRAIRNSVHSFLLSKENIAGCKETAEAVANLTKISNYKQTVLLNVTTLFFIG